MLPPGVAAHHHPADDREQQAENDRLAAAEVVGDLMAAIVARALSFC